MRQATCPPLLHKPPLSTSLSHRLREDTRQSHVIVERQLRLPEAITCRADYVAFLRRFFSLLRPMEKQLFAFPDWEDLGIDVAEHCQAAWLEADLRSLQPGVPLPPHAPPEALPRLAGFAQALGALYVLKGSMMGGEVILRHLLAAGIDGVASASRFLGAGRMQAGGHWQAFRTRLDRYGHASPEDASDVVAGAEASFRSIGTWMQSTRWREM